MVESTRITEVLAHVGRELGEEAPRLVADLTQLLSVRIPELSKDSRLIDMLRASISANLTTVCQMLANHIEPEATQPPTAAIEYAIRHAQNNLPGSSLIRAYQVGQRLLLERAMVLVSQQELDSAEQLAAIQALNEQVHAYTDRVLAISVDTHENERRQRFTARARQSRAIVQRLLRGESVDAQMFGAETGYTLSGTHRAFVVWMREGAPTGAGSGDLAPDIEPFARRVAAVLAPGAPSLLVSVDSTTMWGWVHLQATGNRGGTGAATVRPALETLGESHTPFRIAYGRALAGAEGFRRSHEQAQGALRVATDVTSYADAAVVASDDPHVSLAALLMRDVPAARAWVDDTLGDLAGPTATARAMRETLAAYLANGESYARTAKALGVHRNTVAGRLDRYFASRRATDADLVEVVVAIRMLELFSSAQS